MKKALTAALLFSGASLIAPASMAANHFHHGTNCEIIAGSNASWVRDPAWGWVNNSTTASLPLICPITSGGPIGLVRVQFYNRNTSGLSCWMTMTDAAGLIVFQDDRVSTTASSGIQHFSWSPVPQEEFANMTCSLPTPGALGPAALSAYFTVE